MKVILHISWYLHKIVYPNKLFFEKQNKRQQYWPIAQYLQDKSVDKAMVNSKKTTEPLQKEQLRSMRGNEI